MATLKEHQNAMVDLLANGSAIPASAARLAHALHDVLGLLLERDSGPRRSRVSEHMGTFTQDVRLAADLDSAVSPRGSTLIDHLRAELANVTNQRDTYKARCESLELDLEVTSAALREVQDAVALEGICLTNLLLRARDK
ncbi:hypothetical protein [Hafnia phage TS33]|nr:hypothetical protein [Hafnia phage TS33]